MISGFVVSGSVVSGSGVAGSVVSGTVGIAATDCGTTGAGGALESDWMASVTTIQLLLFSQPHPSPSESALALEHTGCPR